LIVLLQRRWFIWFEFCSGDWARGKSCRVLQISCSTNSSWWRHCDIDNQSFYESLRNCNCCRRIHSPLGISFSTSFHAYSLLQNSLMLQFNWHTNFAFETRQLPRGTHQWSSFLTPEELVLILQRAGINVRTLNELIIHKS